MAILTEVAILNLCWFKCFTIITKLSCTEIIRFHEWLIFSINICSFKIRFHNSCQLLTVDLRYHLPYSLFIRSSWLKSSLFWPLVLPGRFCVRISNFHSSNMFHCHYKRVLFKVIQSIALSLSLLKINYFVNAVSSFAAHFNMYILKAHLCTDYHYHFDAPSLHVGAVMSEVHPIWR